MLNSFLQAQKNDSVLRKNVVFSIAIKNGPILTTNYSLKEYEQLKYVGYSAELLKQTTGKKDWKNLYNLPQYGFGITIDSS